MAAVAAAEQARAFEMKRAQDQEDLEAKWQQRLHVAKIQREFLQV